MSYNANHGKNVKGKGKRKKKKKKAVGVTNHADSGEVFWHDARIEEVLAVVVAVTGQGGAVMFSRSQEGGTLGIRVYHDDHDVETVWARPDEDLGEKLIEIADYYATYGENEEGP